MLSLIQPGPSPPPRVRERPHKYYELPIHRPLRGIPAAAVGEVPHFESIQLTHFTNPDALIIGGGPAGSTTALLLARAGWRVVLVERKRFPRQKVCGEYLSGTNWPLLAALGLTDAFRQLAGPDVVEVGLFVGQSAYRARLPRPTGVGNPWGRALGREHLDSLLLTAAASAGVEVLQPADCETIRREPIRISSAEFGWRAMLRLTRFARRWSSPRTGRGRPVRCHLKRNERRRKTMTCSDSKHISARRHWLRA